MATAAKPTTYAHITKEEGVCGGRASIDATRVRVVNVVFLHKEGLSPAQIRERYPDLDQVHAALAYYYDHVEEIEAELREDEGWEEEHERLAAEHRARHQAK